MEFARRRDKSKLTPERQEKFIKALLLGATYRLACSYAGFDYSTYRGWMRVGEYEEEGGRHRMLWEAVKEAEGQAAVKWLKKIERASKKDWTAAAWKLERRFWKEYSKHVETLGIKELADKIEEAIKKGDSINDEVKCSEAPKAPKE